ncbi:MAG: hypothetical protein BV459_08815 [Thermoplasmata archaeon M11B2D]|nr:MAG: hypothetical protein BV459_08815 [Thermoplasmata archaeon M11B2D]
MDIDNMSKRPPFDLDSARNASINNNVRFTALYNHVISNFPHPDNKLKPVKFSSVTDVSRIQATKRFVRSSLNKDSDVVVYEQTHNIGVSNADVHSWDFYFANGVGVDVQRVHNENSKFNILFGRLYSKDNNRVPCDRIIREAGMFGIICPEDKYVDDIGNSCVFGFDCADLRPQLKPHHNRKNFFLHEVEFMTAITEIITKSNAASDINEKFMVKHRIGSGGGDFTDNFMLGYTGVSLDECNIILRLTKTMSWLPGWC